MYIYSISYNFRNRFKNPNVQKTKKKSVSLYLPDKQETERQILFVSIINFLISQSNENQTCLEFMEEKIYWFCHFFNILSKK